MSHKVLRKLEMVESFFLCWKWLSDNNQNKLQFLACFKLSPSFYKADPNSFFWQNEICTKRWAKRAHIVTQNVAFEFWHFQPIFVLLKITSLVTLFDRKLQVFKNSPKWIIFGIFNQLLSTQNANVARFARNVKMRLFVIFKHRGALKMTFIKGLM